MLVTSAEGADPSIVVQKLEALENDLHVKATEAKSVKQRIEELIASADVMLFMKGSTEAPKCGFSSKVISALHEANIAFSTFDILQDEDIRQARTTNLGSHLMDLSSVGAEGVQSVANLSSALCQR